jgi:HPt (histidine-containing phosphotransfer) domain-containing protein
MAPTSDGMVAVNGVGSPRVDPSVVSGLVDDLGPEHVAEVCALFLADARQLAGAVRSAHQAGDADEAARIAHRLKSACGFVGATEISRLCTEIGRLARDGRLAGMGPRPDILDRELEHVAAELAGLVA